MNIQKFILTMVKYLPGPLVRLMAGKPLEIDGNRLDTHLHLLAKMAPTPDADNPPSVEELRAEIHETFLALNAPRRANVAVRDAIIDGGAGTKGEIVRMPIRVYEPYECLPHAPAILFFHQGGLVVMDLDTDDTFCTIMADICAARVISLDYRLCPEHKFPAPLDDAMALWDYVQANADVLGIDPTRIALAGDSAGGFIAANMCQMLRDKKATPMPIAQLLAYPWVSSRTDAGGSLDSCADSFPLNRATMDFFTAMVFPNGEGMDSPLANPLENDLTGLPPAIIGTAGFDPIRDQGDAYADKLRDAGVVCDHFRFTHLCHSFLAMGNVSRAAVAASEQLANALKVRL